MKIDVLQIVDGQVGGEPIAALGINKSAQIQGIKSYLIFFVKNDSSHGRKISKYDKNIIKIKLCNIKIFNLFVIYAVLNRLIKKTSLIHIHGVWPIYSVMSLLICSKLNKNFLISPHGCLEKWSLNNKKVKKKIGLLILKKFLKSAKCFFVTSGDEAQSVIRVIGDTANIVKHKLGVETPCVPRSLESYKKKCILFVSRVHPKKGVDRLIKAFIKIEKNDWNLKIAGPSEPSYLMSLKKIVSKYRYQETIEFLGPLEKTEINHLYSNSSFLALPTHSENFGFVIAESLAFKLPVLTTLDAPWNEINEFTCGYCVENNQGTLEKYMKIMMKLSPEELRNMGKHGEELIKERYTWGIATKNITNSYKLMLNEMERI